MAEDFNPQLSELLPDFAALRAAWATKREALGGLTAMAGFDFQLTKAVLILLRQVSSGRGASFVEALSDLVEADQGLIITQAKRTLSSSAFHSGLLELWGIYKLALTETPALAQKLRFVVASEHRQLKDWETSLARWAPTDSTHPKLPDFKSRVTISISPFPRHEAARLLIRDFKDYEPFARLDQMIGRLMGASGSRLDEAVETVRLDLEAQLLKARETEHRFEMWGAEDRPPKTVELETDERKAVRIGERLTSADLREGRLGNRKIYGEIEKHCETWLAAESELYKLPVYWIEGRSGCGKSAALLHLGARLFAQNPDRVILWLGEKVGKIDETIRWAAPLIQSGRLVVLLLDDPFTAARQSEFARGVEAAQSEVERIRSNVGDQEFHLPVILCCGPTEQMIAAEDGCGAHISCSSFELPHERREDLEELAGWYAQRTGRPATAMTGNVLLVQQMFEWAKGSIADFSARFRDRMRGFDEGEKHGPVFSTVAQILALNRLYVDYPSSDLIELRRGLPVLDSALITLGEEESHFDFQAGTGGGVRLTHPHLADAIYRQWFSRTTDRPYRKEHLNRALKAALDQPDELPEVRHAPLWSIGRLSLRVDGRGRELDPAMYGRIDAIRPELREVLADIFADRSASDTPLEDLPVWVALGDELDLQLKPDPAMLLRQAMEAVPPPSRGLRLSCHRLLASRENKEANQKAVADCLNRLATYRDAQGAWHDWAPVAMDYIMRTSPDAIISSISYLVTSNTYLPRKAQLVHMLLSLPTEAGRNIAIEWLQRTASTVTGWPTVLSKLQSVGHCKESDAIAQRFLAASRNDPSWAFIWLGLLDAERGDQITLIQDGLAFLGIAQSAGGQPASLDNPGWDRIWQRLNTRLQGQSGYQEALHRAGLNWIENIDDDAEGWTRVWDCLWKDSDGEGGELMRRQLLKLAELKLSGARASLQGWSFVWNDAIDEVDLETKPYFVRMGAAWLQEADCTHLGWSYVWEKMLTCVSATMKGDLVSRGLAWLDQASFDQQGWPFIWGSAMKSLPPEQRGKIDQLGMDFLRSMPESTSWSRVACTFLDEVTSDHLTTALALSRDWVSVGIERPGWKQLFDKFIAHGALQISAEVQNGWATAMDDKSESHQVRSNAWYALHKLGFNKTHVLSTALEIISDSSMPSTVRADICGYVLRAALTWDERSRVVEFALPVMQAETRRGTWLWLWTGLNVELPQVYNKAVAHVGVAWLLANSKDRSWPDVYLKLVYLDADRVASANLHHHAVMWLKTTVGHPSWSKVWRVVPNRREALRDAEIGRNASGVVAKHFGDRNWASLWLALHAQAGAETKNMLCALGVEWLGTKSYAAAWYRVWHECIANRSITGEQISVLQEVAVLSLVANPAIPQWQELFIAVQKHWPEILDKLDILKACDAWLSKPGENSSRWALVIRWRLSKGSSPWDDDTARQEIVNWLSETENTHSLWARVYGSVGRRIPLSVASHIHEKARAWLRSASELDKSWPHVFAALWKRLEAVAEARTELKRLGSTWLNNTERDCQGRQLVARSLHTYPKSNKNGKAPDVSIGGRKALRR